MENQISCSNSLHEIFVKEERKKFSSMPKEKGLENFFQISSTVDAIEKMQKVDFNNMFFNDFLRLS